jgi:hypothetical protein
MTDDPREKFRRLLKSEEETQAEPPPVAPRVETSATPPAGFPALDKDNMPLPRRVSETDIGGTRVTPAAFEIGTSPRHTQYIRGAPPPNGPRGIYLGLKRFANRGCVVQGIVLMLFLVVIAGLCLASVACMSTTRSPAHCRGE